MRIITTILALFCMSSMLSQTNTRRCGYNIVEYLSEHCPSMFYVADMNGRNETIRGRAEIDNSMSHATAKILNGLRPLLDELPYERKMTDEKAGDLYEGKIVMRLKPEGNDTSAYFLMTYNRTQIEFKIGMNSPKSHIFDKGNPLDSDLSFDHDELTTEKAALIENIYSQLKHKSDCLVIDTVFTNRSGGTYDWLSASADAGSQTNAQVLLRPVNDDKEMRLWLRDILNSIEKIGRCDELTVSIQTQFKNNKETGITILLTYRTSGVFNIYDMAFHKGHLCMVRVRAHGGENSTTIPKISDIVDHLIGDETHPHELWNNPPDEYIDLMEKEMIKQTQKVNTIVVDTLFVSNDDDGHVWWSSLNKRCPTRATMVISPSIPSEFDALYKLSFSLLNGSPNFKAWVSDDEDDYKMLLFMWTDKTGHHHAYIVCYDLVYQQMFIERCDGEEPGDICIPHYNHKWFENSK